MRPISLPSSEITSPPLLILMEFMLGGISIFGTVGRLSPSMRTPPETLRRGFATLSGWFVPGRLTLSVPPIVAKRTGVNSVSLPATMARTATTKRRPKR